MLHGIRLKEFTLKLLHWNDQTNAYSWSCIVQTSMIMLANSPLGPQLWHQVQTQTSSQSSFTLERDWQQALAKMLHRWVRNSNFFSAKFCTSTNQVNQDNKTCRDFNNGTCTLSICKFQHKCSKYFTSGNSQRPCRRQQHNIQPQPTQFTNLQASNTNQSQQVWGTTQRAP